MCQGSKNTGVRHIVEDPEKENEEENSSKNR